MALMLKTLSRLKQERALTPIPGSPGGPGLPDSPVSPCDVTVICELVCEKFIITLTSNSPALSAN